jgi:phosphoglycerate dehydrogenase-like enzyme
MPKLNILVIFQPDNYSLRILDAVKDVADFHISNQEEEVEKLAPDAEVILYSGLTGKAVNFSKVWPHAHKVRWIHSLSAGVEKLLFPALIESDIPVTNARGVFKRSLAEFAVLGMLYHYKRVRRLVDSQKAHKWDDFSTRFVRDRVMGVVGYGEIGRECAILAKGMGAKIHAVRRNPERSKNDELLDRIFPPDELGSMLAGVDVVLAAAPLTPETHHMLSDVQFAVMKQDAIVINVGRGPVIDEEALIRALQQQRIGGAALDVFEEEPLPASSPLWDMENVLISPHCTDRTVDPDWLELSMQLFVTNLQRYIAGEPLQNIVDKKAGY